MEKIDIRIPFEPGEKLGAEYNRIMKESNFEWVLFLDHDVFLCNPHWYLLCQKAIEQHPEAGLFTCWTNNLGRTAQRDENCPKTTDLDEHIEYARSVFDKNQYKCTQIDLVSGFFMLIRKTAWKKVHGFPGIGLFKEDWDFSRLLYAYGFNLYRIDGLYVYHLRDRKRGSWIPGIKTTKEIRDERFAAKRKK